ncbi:MAG: hypothetical protein J6Y64_03775 [Ruminococcus sp.]|nr:hypothetical protein [Ruminococcus sp.]
MSFFIFNDVNNVELGLIITKPIVRPTWSEQINSESIPGRASYHRRLTGNYADATLHINTALMDDATPNTLRNIYQKLQGEGVMVIGNDIADLDDEEKAPIEYMNVCINTIVPEAVALMAAEIPLRVTCYPFAYAIEPTVLDIKNNTFVSDQEQHPAYVTNNYSVFWEPVIEYRLATIEDEVAFDVGGSWFNVKTPDVIKNAIDPTRYKIVIDSENRICYYVRPDGVKVSCTQNTSGKFPLLRVGVSEIMHTKTLYSATLNEKERWL